jgi:hypothetical protein
MGNNDKQSTDAGGGATPEGGSGSPGSRAVGDFALALWLLFAGFAFWSPYLGAGVSAVVTAPVYAVVLIVALVALGLRFARGRGKDSDS